MTDDTTGSGAPRHRFTTKNKLIAAAVAAVLVIGGGTAIGVTTYTANTKAMCQDVADAYASAYSALADAHAMGGASITGATDTGGVEYITGFVSTEEQQAADGYEPSEGDALTATVTAALEDGALPADATAACSTRDEVARSAAHGIRLAEFPTTRDAAEACRRHSIRTIMGAPNLIRGGSHSGNVAARELAEAGLLDIISSDYVPSALLSAAALLAGIWGDWPRAMACVTATPAAAAGLADRGRIAPGLRADLIRFRLVGGTPVLRQTWVKGTRVA